MFWFSGLLVSGNHKYHQALSIDPTEVVPVRVSGDLGIQMIMSDVVTFGLDNRSCLPLIGLKIRAFTIQ